MKHPLHLVHASDIHLDTDYYGGDHNLAGRDFYRKIFHTLLEEIKALQPDLFMLPGDLFDSNRASEDTIVWAMDQLAALKMPVVMIPGNHDCLEEGGIYRRHDFNKLPNVFFLHEALGQIIELPKLRAIVWGRGMADHSPEFKPLQHMPAPRPGWWNLAMGHGIYVGKDENSYRSSPISAGEILTSEFDYIALGHHHALLDVSNGKTGAYYCGAPAPMDATSQGTFVSLRLSEGRRQQTSIHTLDSPPWAA